MPRRGARIRCRKSGKAKFTNWNNAAAAAHRVDGDDSRAYWCEHCGGYHITGNEKRKQGN